MRVAITGSNGFLGQYLVKECLRQGFDVTALVRKTANTKGLSPDGRLSIAPIDYNQIAEELKTMKNKLGQFDFFIHNAGKTTSIKREDYTNINTKMTGQIVDAIAEAEFLTPSGKLVYISSYTAHGPVGVNHPVSCYGESKKKAEELIQGSTNPSVIFRPTAIYGAGDRAFLPLFKAANKGIYPLTRSDQKISMIHAADLASIVVGDMKTREGILHVSDGTTYSHAQFRDTLSDVLGKKIRNIHIPVFISKMSLWLSDVWNYITKGSPDLTLEKFEEISQDWHLHEDESLDHTDYEIQYDLKRGFEDAYDYYLKNKKL